MRLFIAINFPDEVKSVITKIRDDIKASAFCGNFTVDANLHLTLVFLGECDRQQAGSVKAVMDEIKFPEFALMLEKVGYFKRDGGNTWWIGLKDNKPLSDLQADLSGRLQRRGFMLENRRYVPHVTIGREVKAPTDFIKPDVRQVSFNVTSIELMLSERINGKLVYTPVYSKNS